MSNLKIGDLAYLHKAELPENVGAICTVVGSCGLTTISTVRHGVMTGQLWVCQFARPLKSFSLSKGWSYSSEVTAFDQDLRKISGPSTDFPDLATEVPDSSTKRTKQQILKESIEKALEQQTRKYKQEPVT
jgi:hypothetical protein